MKKLAILYGNCQMDGIRHFLAKSRMGDEYIFQVFHNWRLMLNEEETGAQLLEASHACDVFIYQPCRGFSCQDGTVIPPTDQLSLPARSIDGRKAISFAYLLNHGFFPLIKVGAGWDGWWTGEGVKTRVREFLKGTPNGGGGMTIDYFADKLPYDCARRFIECLAEQSRREQETDIKMVPFILENYRKRRLFLTYNHPTSALFEQLTRQIIALLVESESLWECVAPITTENRGSSIADRIKGLSWSDDNEANMNGVQPVHPAVCRELGLEYQPTDNAIEYYQGLLEQMMRELR